jgi:excisionase family DNA binding protein
MDEPQEILYNPVDAAHMLGITTETLAKWARKGWISATRTPGNHRRYTMTEIRRADEAQRGGRFTIPGGETRRQLMLLEVRYPAWYCFADRHRFWGVLLDPAAPGVLYDTDVDGLREQIHYYQGSRPR